jgi:hypothetical protein
VRILLDALLVLLERRKPLPRVAAHLIPAQVVLVRERGGGHVLFEHLALACRQRQRQRLDDLSGELVLQAEEVSHRDLRGVRPQDGR